MLVKGIRSQVPTNTLNIHQRGSVVICGHPLTLFNLCGRLLLMQIG
jgi:hypothetical protein